ncbi:MAG: CHAT domain-containing protein [Pseudonocardia sp.]
MSSRPARREVLLRSLRDRIERCVQHRDCRAVLDGAAVSEVDELIEVIDNSPLDVTAQQVVAMLRWARYQLTAGAGQQAAFDTEGRAAMPHFSAVHMHEPRALPPEVREVLDDLAEWTDQASALMDRAGGSGGLAALNDAIDLLDRVLAFRADTDPQVTVALAELAVALQHRFLLAEDVPALDRAVTITEKCVRLTRADDPERISRISLHKLLLLDRHRLRRDPEDLRWAISLGYRTLIEVPDGSELVGNIYADFIPIYLAEHAYTADVLSLDKAIDHGRRAIAERTRNRRTQTAARSDVAIALVRRGEHVGSRQDVEEAVAHLDAATEVFPDTDFDGRAMRSDLGNALRTLGELTEDADALRRSVVVLGRLVARSEQLTDPRLPGFRQNLGIAQRSLAQLTGDADVLRGAAASLRSAAEAFTGPLRGAAYSDLAATLRELSTLDNDLRTMDESIVWHRRAVDTAEQGDPASALERSNYAVALRSRYEVTGSEADRVAAVAVFRDVAGIDVAPPGLRLRAARSWGRLQAAVGEWADAAAGLAVGVELLPRVAERNLARGDQERELRQERDLVGDAVAAVLHDGQVGRAAELLEQGRGVLLAHALDLRADLTRLAEQDKALAADVVRLRAALDSNAGDADHRHRWLREWNDLLAGIRRVPGFERFLMPLTVEDMQQAAVAGPIVLINVSGYRSDALIVEPDGITVVPLPGLTPETMSANGIAFLAGLDRALDAERGDGTETAGGSTVRTALAWLWDSVTAPVLEHLGAAAGVPAGSRPRVWWSPSSLLTMLPLHAAGRHTADGRQTVMDRVVSSYTPTVRSLVYARNVAAGPDAAPSPLVVAMPITPGQADLRGARQEADLLRERFPGTTVLMGEAARPARVLEELGRHRWLHLSCHGSSDIGDPSSSHLMLAGGERLRVVDVAGQTASGDLAFLSACNTGRGGLALVDEAVHLAGAFQLAGYRHVLAASWPIYDHLTVQLTRDVYERITPGEPSVDEVAVVLHDAVQQVRDERPDAPWLWAGYVHFGA